MLNVKKKKFKEEEEKMLRGKKDRKEPPHVAKHKPRVRSKT